MLLKSVDKSKEVAKASKPECVLDSVLMEIYSNDINNKGNRIHTRRKSKSEIAMKLSDKPKRLCGYCKKYVNHDSRNCSRKKKGLQDEDVDDVEQDEGEDTDMYPSD
ncbi:hypothetical protein Tco_0190034 [Tanacetum coccineum]